MKRFALTTLFLLVFSSMGWSKLKKEEQEYLDDQFQSLKDQIAALQKQNKTLGDQLATVTKQLADMQKIEQDTQDETHKDRDFLESLNTSLLMQRMAEEQTTGAQKEIVALLQDAQRKLNSALSNAASPTPTVVVAPAEVPAPSPATAQPASATTPVYYVVLVEGDKYTLGIGSGQHVQTGTKLWLFHKGAPGVQVGEMQVTDIVDENNCHARMLTPGITAQADDIVKVE